jgi:ABC-type multidrug transport system ATPase subunit
MDLLSNPAVLFVDEPTSGLDSKTAEDVVQALRDLARGKGDGVERTIISTIHQPSWRIFALFDKVVLLTRGRLAFEGTLPALERFFTHQLGLGSPPKENPADHYMRMLQDEAEVDRICAEFARLQCGTGAEDAPVQHERDYDPEPLPRASDSALVDTAVMLSFANRQKRLEEMPRYPTSLRQQFATLFRRSTYEAIKDPAKVRRNLALKLIVGLLVGFVWWRAADPPTLQHIFPIEGAMFSIVLNR